MTLPVSFRFSAALIALCAMGACAPRSGITRAVPLNKSPSVVRLSNVPFYPDNTDQCGPASLASVLNFWGESITPTELKSEVYVRRLKGSLPMDMMPALQSHGLAAQLISGTFDDVKTELRAGRPLIAYLDFGTRRHPIGHYVVITGFDDRRRGLYIHSASRQNKFASYTRFNRGWKDTDHWLLLARPAPSGIVAKSTSTLGPIVDSRPSTGRPPRYQPTLSADEYVQLGEIYESQGKGAEAKAQYQLALKVDKRSTRALSAMGNTAFAENNLALAERYFERALKTDSNDAASNNNLAMIYLAENRKLDRAEELATKALKTNLRPYAFDTLAHIYLKRGQVARARAAMDRAVASAEGNDELIRQLTDSKNKLSEIR